MTQRASLHEAVLDKLGAALAAGRIAPGTVLRTDRVEAEHGVSRSVVREALRVLESMQMVAIRRRIGVTVRPATHWNALDPRIIRWRLAGPQRHDQLRTLSELRTGIEPVAAALAARHATPEQCGALTGAVIGMSVTAKRGDLEAYLAHDSTFHRTLLAASGNELFGALADVVVELLAGRTHHHLMPAAPEPVAIRLHAAVAEAVQAGDAAAAEDAMRAIAREAMEALAEAEAGETRPESGSARTKAGRPVVKSAARRSRRARGATG